MNTKWSGRITLFLFVVLGSAMIAFAIPASQEGVWTRIGRDQLRSPGIDTPNLPGAFETFRLDQSALRSVLGQAPEEFTRGREVVLALPMPNGTFGRFAIEHSLVVEPGLLVKYPELGATYRGRGLDDPTATVRFDFLPSGFHAMILSPSGTVIVDPFSQSDTDNYISYFKRDRERVTNFECEVGETGFDSFLEPGDPGKLDFLPDAAAAPEVTSGTQLRTYRLALTATNEYCAVTGSNTVAGCLAAQVLIMNRVNGVYERDVAIRMVIIANNHLIAFAGDNLGCPAPSTPCTAANDGLTNNSGSALLGENQAKIDSVIGTANYDIGHVFSTGGGGVASLNSPCSSSSKARGVTGLPSPFGDPFSIDFVAHEMGHQFGANHTFNTQNGGCSGNRSTASAYEPGSGITIMAYAGLCGSQNLSNNSIDTFHVKSLEAIVNFSQNGNGNTCAVSTATGNTPPSVTGPGNFDIPKQTPFSLTAVGSDANGDSLTYDWQQYDLGAATSSVPNGDGDGVARPIFRPYLPTVGGTRTFPRLNHILNTANVPPNFSGGFMTGEILPSITRTMTFQVIARDNRANGGGINTATSILTVDGNSGPFNITSPNTNTTYQGNSSQNVTWNVANTSSAPVNAANVKISMSTDGGVTFPTTLLGSTPNDGAQVVTIPVGDTMTARIKVEAVGNVFFDISDANFTVSGLAAPIRSRADFDGDGRSDLSVFRPADPSNPGNPDTQGFWYADRSTAGFFGQKFGISTDIPTPGDFDNDGRTELSVFRANANPALSFFYVFNTATSTFSFANLGQAGDIPIVADYDGDGRSDFAIYRPSNNLWRIIRSSGGTTETTFGAAGAMALTGDFDGDAKSDLGFFTGTFFIVRPSAGGEDIAVPLGQAGDLPVPADYNGDGKDDYAVFRPSNGTWYIIDPLAGQLFSLHFGTNGDVPVPGDYDGDGRDDIAVFRAGVWYLNRSTSGFFASQFGVSVDIPVPNQYIP